MQGEIFRILLILGYTVISVAGMAMIKDAESPISVKFGIGFGLYVLGFFIWIGIILRMMPLSQAFPLAAGSLILGTQIAGWMFLGDRLSAAHMGGIALILAGVVLVGIPNPIAR